MESIFNGSNRSSVFALTLFERCLLILSTIALGCSLIYLGTQLIQWYRSDSYSQAVGVNSEITFGTDRHSEGNLSTPSRGEANSIVSDLPGKSPKTFPQESYLKEAEKIVLCSKQMSARTGSKDDIFTKETVDGLAEELKRIAESPHSDRGVPYISDVANSFCGYTLDPALVNYKKSNPDQELFEIILNFHLRQWDRAMSIEGRLEKFTFSKLSNSLNRELMVVRTSTQKVIIGVVSAFLALIFFVLAFLYVGYQALLRYLLAFSEVTDISGVVEESEPIKPESLKISMSGGVDEN